MEQDLFKPPFYLRNSTLQNILASSKIRTWGKNRMRTCAVERILEIQGGVRLQGFHSRHNSTAKGLVVLIHGWEGSEKSAYLVTTGKILFDAGYDVFRLNLRDHGESHHLNKGLFFGTLLEESFNAVQMLAEDHSDQPISLIGFSMGGNFAIRIAKRCLQHPILNLKHIFCINPPLDPMQATQRIDEIPLMRYYFTKKWHRSMRKKQQLYPTKYDFSDAFAEKSIMDMTELLLKRYTDYPDASTYFGKYTLKSGYLNKIQIPLSIITSEDDPIISANDFRELTLSDKIELIIQPFGGHCGYIQNLRFNAWYWQILQDRLKTAFA